MSDPSPERPERRLRFTLRKLLLWTVVVALYLSLVKASDPDMGEEAVISMVLTVVWIGGVGIVRTVFSPAAAACSSVAAGTLVCGYASFVAHNASSRGGAFLDPCVIAVGFLGGLVLFGVTEVLLRAVNWVDRFVGSL